MRRSNNTQFMTGPLHYLSASNFVLFGNVVGSSRDEVDMESYTLKIRTNTISLLFTFPNMEILKNVVRIRSILRKIPLAEMALDFTISEEEEKNHLDYIYASRDFIVEIFDHIEILFKDEKIQWKKS